jgi:hypothetical protein
MDIDFSSVGAQMGDSSDTHHSADWMQPIENRDGDTIVTIDWIGAARAAAIPDEPRRHTAARKSRHA